MNTRRIITVVSSMVCIWLAMSVMACFAGEPAEPGRATLNKLLKAIEANDYDSFVADGSDAVKAAMTKQKLEGVSNLFAPRMKKG